MRYDGENFRGKRVDLCQSCADALKRWLDDPHAAPLGYRYKPRPCPHNVPCADPEGCSGKELVPI